IMSYLLPQEILEGLGRLFGPDQVRDAFLGVLAPFGATQLDLGIIEQMAAPGAAPPGIVLEKLDFGPAFGTFRYKDVAGFPEAGILAGALHLFHGWSLTFPGLSVAATTPRW